MPSGPRIRTDNVFGTTTDNPLTNVATTMNSAGLANLAAVSSAHAIIVLDPQRTAGAPEMVVVTAHTAAATSATITRGAYGTAARQHAAGTLWVHAPTIEDAIRIVTSSTRPSDPYRGQLIFETDTNSFVARDTSDTWQTAIPLGAWTAYTPTLVQSVTVTKTVTSARWSRVGRRIDVTVSLAVTGAGTANNTLLVGLPVAAVATGPAIGVGWIYDASATTRYVVAATVDTSTSQVGFINDASANAIWGIAPNLGIASGDIITFTATYEAAS